ncbi:MAG: type III-B CRISPR module RAMP protein Cmr6 [Rhodobacteraceae bacterium]|nr:type III-B CRISPR module RAMP protein Cmr6 [Paracoccaceae bacterium]
MTAVPDLCLPETAVELLDRVSSRSQHPGLKLDKLSWSAKQEVQRSLIDNVCACEGDNKLLNSLSVRRSKMLDTLGAVRFGGQTAGPMTLHLARANALENAGIALHPVYGFAWVPGPSLKGMTRAWAETVWKQAEPDQQVAGERIREAFGTTDKSGRILFHDAWPTKWPRLESDILNCHHSKYYSDGAAPPDDSEQPVPVYFLAVAGQTEFEFALSDRMDTHDGLLELVAHWMCAALEHAGVGAKSAAGYGRFMPGKVDSLDRSARTFPNNGPWLRRKYHLALVSPAFLAGSRRQKADCDLRTPSLRGLLRWWWRTMHAHHTTCEDLARLEASLWGDTNRASAISLSLRAGEDNRPPERYDKQKRDSNLPASKSRRTSQGLFYLSYGMDESNSESRWHCHTGDSWELTLTARATSWQSLRPGDGSSAPIDAAMVLKQAEAALWLLTRYGGVGAKSRKGFGSFRDVPVEGIERYEDCIAAGRELRERCRINSPAGHGAGTPALERLIGPVEIKSRWVDPWLALDHVGQAYQSFAKELSRGDKSTLGLPRKDISDCRRASPAHWSLTRDENDCLTIRLIALPTAKKTKVEVLERLVRFANDELNREVSHRSTKGHGRRQPRPKPSQLERPFSPRQKITAELLEETTKKGGRKAKDTYTGISGNIENSESVPPDAKPGQVVELTVKSTDRNNPSFLWPTPQTEQKQGLKNSSRNKRQERGRRR